jgi:hypothetical protein
LGAASIGPKAASLSAQLRFYRIAHHETGSNSATAPHPGEVLMPRADVVGKGVSAALLMANVQASDHAYASELESAAWLCGEVNKLLYEK